MNKSVASILLFSIVLLMSCSNSTENKVTQVLEQKIYPNPKDTSTYLYTTYYENGQAKEEGKVRNSLRTGNWHKWYADGTLKIVNKYIEGNIDPSYIEVVPQIIFDDSLKLGELTQVQIIGFHLDDLGIDGYLIDGKVTDPDNYDISIIPTKRDTIFFYQHVLNPKPVSDKETDYVSMAKDFGISVEEMKEVFGGMYIKKQVLLKTAIVY